MRAFKAFNQLMNRLSLQMKLIVTFGLGSFFILVIGGVGYVSLERVSNSYEHVTQTDLPKTVALTSMRYNLIGVGRSVAFLTRPDVTNEIREEHEYKLEHHIKKYDEADVTYAAFPASKEELEHHKNSRELWKQVVSLSKELVKLARSFAPADRAKLYSLLGKDFSNAMDDLSEDLGILREEQGKEAKRWSDEATALAKKGRLTSLILVAVGFFGALFVGIVFSRKLANELRQVTESLNREAEKVAQVSRQISTSSEDLATSASEQAASLQETTAALDEVSSMVQKNADNANHSREQSDVSKKSAETGRAVIVEMIGAIEEINSSNNEIMAEVNRSNKQISEIVDVISAIGNKTKVINDIVFQTKLLSFNASVEAARAGEHGKGFAVVAEEVGKLAQMSGGAAKEIGDMLDSSIKRVETIVEQTKTNVSRLVTEGKNKVEQGAKIAKRCGTVLEEIVSNVSGVNQMVSEISAASQEQSAGIREINNAMNQLDKATQKNSLVAQEAAGASENLSGQAESLRNMVRSLMSVVEGWKDADQKLKKPSSHLSAVSLPVPASSPAPKPQAEPAVAKVIPISTAAPATATPVSHEPVKLAAGGGAAVPSETDPRFSDI